MNNSLCIAFSGLLERYQLPIRKLKLGKTPSWEDVTKSDNRITVKEVGQAGTWPHDNDAIVKFRHQSVETPYIDDSGFQRANMLDIYCLVADATQKLVFDSNGEIREAGSYGQPVEWASYNVDVKRKPAPPEKLHKMLTGETVWSIARRFRINSQELIEHNDIDDPHNVPDGTILHLPVPKEAKPETPVTYEHYKSPRPMHVSHGGGATKFSFGNVRKWEDITPTGKRYAEHTNIDIVAVATVPIGEESAAYYMDANAFNNGEVRYTIGFSHSHLTDGYYVAPEPTPEPVVPPKEAEPVADLPIPEDHILDERISPNLFKASYRAFPSDKVYIARETIIVNDTDDRGVPGTLFKGKGVLISGTFEKDGHVYARPKPGIHSFWYGIPLGYLKSEEELDREEFYTELTIPEKKAMHQKLKPTEFGMYNFAKTIRRGTEIVDKYVNKNRRSK